MSYAGLDGYNNDAPFNVTSLYLYNYENTPSVNVQGEIGKACLPLSHIAGSALLKCVQHVLSIA